MIRLRSGRTVADLGIAATLTLFLGACGSMSLTSPTPAPEAPEMPASIRADEIVGNEFLDRRAIVRGERRLPA